MPPALLGVRCSPVHHDANPSDVDDGLVDPPRGARLRSGWTTGTCAAAASKAAAMACTSGFAPKEVEIPLPSGDRVSFEVLQNGLGGYYVVKDAGDDPDCTHGAHITATAELTSGVDVVIDGGHGVGRVTLPGLGLEVGSAAINPVPKKMITEAVREVTALGISIVISVPDGEIMAQKTTNSRLGIVGGISILGTTGIVRPFSTASFRASVVQQIDVIGARGLQDVVFATGSRSEKLAREIFPELEELSFVEVGDFTGVAVKRLRRTTTQHLTWVGMAGKISKLAQGTLMTHFHRSHLDTSVLSRAAEATTSSTMIRRAATETTTARHFYEVCVSQGELGPLIKLCEMARDQLQDASGKHLSVSVVLSDFDGGAVICRVD